MPLEDFDMSFWESFYIGRSYLEKDIPVSQQWLFGLERTVLFAHAYYDDFLILFFLLRLCTYIFYFLAYRESSACKIP